MGANLTKILVAVGCIVVGLVMLPVAAPILGLSLATSGTVTTVLVGAGISGLLACFFGKLTWGEFWKEMSIGALTSFISPYVSSSAKYIIGKISVIAPRLKTLWKVSEIAINSFLSAGSALHIKSTIQGKPFDFKKLAPTFFGNLLSYGIANGLNNLYEKIANHYTKLWKKVTLVRLKFFTEFLKKWRVGQFYCYPLAEFSKNYVTSATVDLIDNVIRKGEMKINWGGALKIAIGMTIVVELSRTGIRYLREVRGDDQRLYDLAKQDELKIRNDDNQKLIDSLDSKDNLQKHVRAPIKFEKGKFKLYDNKDTKSSSSYTEKKSNNDDGILESRAWQDGARIYSTKDAIGTFRSQSEKYNYANVVHEFGDNDDQTPTNVTSPEYVYARSNSNQPVTSSSSPATSSHGNGQNINRKEKSRTTNDNFYFPRSSQSNRDFTNTTNKFNQSETVNETLPVKLHPIICWNMEEQKYTFSNTNEWPAFPHKAKVVGFIGIKKSGRTTAIHSLLFELGYSLNEEQLAKSLLPIGVMMYVLKKHDLILLDCCDVADSVTEEDENIISGYLLEFFTYMASCHLVIHTAIAQKTESDQSEFSEQLVNYIHAKAKLQLSWSSIIQTYGPSMLTVLVRGSKQQCEALDLNSLFSSRLNEENSDKDRITFTQGFQDSKAFTWQYIPEEMITTQTLANDNFAVSTAILERIKNDTNPHGLCVYIQAILAGAIKESGANNENLSPFYNGIEANWQHLFTEIMSNNILSQSVADVANHDTIQEADDQTGGLIQEYIDSVNKLVENSATQGSALATNYKVLCEDIKRRMDIEIDKLDEEKDPIIGFKINIEIAKCLLESSKSETNTQTKENLISWGLHGLTLIHNRSPKAFEHTWMKLCIKTYNVLDLLNTPVIYNVYWHCWNFLSFASSCDFKLELIEWQILEHALHCLKTSANKPRFHFHVLNCLLNFLETEPYLPVIIHPSTKNENNQTSLQLNDEQYYRLKQMTYYGMAEFSRKIVHEAAEQRQSTDMEKYLEEIKDIVNKQIKILASSSSSSTATSSQDESFSALVEHQQFAIVSAALVRLNTDIALYVSKYIIINDEENELINLFSPNSPIEMLQDYHEMIHNFRWLFLQRIASLQDDKCTRILMDNTLSWSTDFLKKLPYDEASKKSHSYAVLFVNTLVIAESVMQKHQRGIGQKKSSKTSSSSRQPMTLNDINKKKEKIEDDEDYGEVRMELLSQKCFKPVLKEFLHGLKSQDPNEYLRSDKVRRYAQYINNLLFAPHNPRIQALSLDLIPIYERNMFRLMTFQMMDLCIKAFWQHHLKKEEPAVANQMSTIYNTRALLRLLNRIHWMTAKKDKNEDIQGFSIIFGSQGSNTSGQNTIHSLPSSNDTNSSETLADEMIQHIGLKNWQNLITLTSIPRTLSDYISKIDPDNSLNIREAIFDMRDGALILLWNLAECSGVSLGISKKVMTTNDFRSANVIGGFSDTTTFDENGINRIRFLVNRVIGQINTNSTTGEASVSEVTTQELHNRFRIGKIRAIELKKHAEISEKIEKQIEEQRLKPNVQAMKEARLRRFGIK